MAVLTLLRHGESEWNRTHRFTGWTDVGLSPQGRREAVEAGRRLRAAAVPIDVAFTSTLRRAADTLTLVLDILGRADLETHTSWRLNERHYGVLQGRTWLGAALRYGPHNVYRWQRYYDVGPPPVAADDPRAPANDPRYAGVDPGLLPRGESVAESFVRLEPFWQETIAPLLRHGRHALIVAHRNSLRGLIADLEGLDAIQARSVRIPTGVPIVYRVDAALHVTDREYLD